jgi:hypothetical protein
VLDLGAVARDLVGREHVLEVQVPGDVEEVPHLLDVGVDGEGLVQVQGLVLPIDERRPDPRPVDRAPRAERLDGRLPALPILERAALDDGATRAYRTAGREELVEELRERRLRQRHERVGVVITLDDVDAAVGRAPRERGAGVDAKPERPDTAQVVDDQRAVLHDERGEFATVEVGERVRRERTCHRLDPRQARADDIGSHQRPTSDPAHARRSGSSSGCVPSSMRPPGLAISL